MKIPTRWMNLLAGCVCASAAFAQQRVSSEPPAPSAPSAKVDAGSSPRASSAQSEAGEPRANASEPHSDTSVDSHAVAAVPAKTAAAGQRAGNASDKLQLSTATVTGDREQPKVMYVVPWKRSDIGDLGGKPMNSLIDEILAPVDRDEFRRQVSYYDTVKSKTSSGGGQPAAEQGEK